MAHLPLPRSRSAPPSENSIDYNPVPPSPRTCRDAFCVKSLRDPVKAEPLSPQRPQTIQCDSLGLITPKGLPALAATFCGPLPHPSTAELQYDLAFVVLCDRSHHLSHQNSGRIASHQIRLGNGDESETAFLQVGNCRLLHHQVTRQPIELLNDDGSDSVGEQRSDHCRPSGAIHRLPSACHPFFPEYLDNLDVVVRRIGFDGLQLAREPVTFNLALSADAEISKCLCHVSIRTLMPL